MSAVVHVDGRGQEWIVEEFFRPEGGPGILVFSREQMHRACWGTPIRWQNTENLRALFSLSIEIPAAG